jgi:hypothetical protein
MAEAFVVVVVARAQGVPHDEVLETQRCRSPPPSDEGAQQTIIHDSIMDGVKVASTDGCTPIMVGST